MTRVVTIQEGMDSSYANYQLRVRPGSLRCALAHVRDRQATFPLLGDVVGLESRAGVVYPLSLLALAPRRFEMDVFALLPADGEAEPEPLSGRDAEPDYEYLQSPLPQRESAEECVRALQSPRAATLCADAARAATRRWAG